MKIKIRRAYFDVLTPANNKSNTQHFINARKFYINYYFFILSRYVNEYAPFPILSLVYRCKDLKNWNCEKNIMLNHYIRIFSFRLLITRLRQKLPFHRVCPESKWIDTRKRIYYWYHHLYLKIFKVDPSWSHRDLTTCFPLLVYSQELLSGILRMYLVVASWKILA